MSHRTPARRAASQGFTLVELVVAMVILALLAAVALPVYSNIQREARIAAVKALGGSVQEASVAVHLKAMLTNNLGGAVGTVWVPVNGASIRVWNGWPDRWWDGIGIALEGATPNAGGYVSTAPYPYGQFTFYGYGNGQLPGGLAGWVMTGAPDTRNCSVTFANDGSGNAPAVTITTSGC